MTSVKGRNGSPRADGSASPAAGSQTLARGLSALQAVASAPSGVTAAEVADFVGVHRTIAYRLLSTLAQARFITKGEDGKYRPAATLAVLGASFDNNVRQLSVPTLRLLADDLGTTVSLLVAEGDQQVAIAVIVPTLVFYQLSFHEGSRYPLDRGSAGIALLSSMPPRPGELVLGIGQRIGFFSCSGLRLTEFVALDAQHQFPKYLRGTMGSKNKYGEAVAKLDEWVNGYLCDSLVKTGLVRKIYSEELKEPLIGHALAPFVVAMDPLDGSSNIVSNRPDIASVGFAPLARIFSVTSMRRVSPSSA